MLDVFTDMMRIMVTQKPHILLNESAFWGVRRWLAVMVILVQWLKYCPQVFKLSRFISTQGMQHSCMEIPGVLLN